MADFITQFAADEGVSRDNFNNRITEANAGLTTVQNAAAAAQSTANTAVSNAATAKTAADNAAAAAATAQGGVNAINNAKGVANGIATLDSNGKVTPAQTSSTRVGKGASYTLALTDAGTMQWIDNSADMTVTLPLNSAVAFPLNTEIEFVRAGTGAVTFAGASGVSLMSRDGIKTIADRLTSVTAKKVSENTWYLAGNLG